MDRSFVASRFAGIRMRRMMGFMVVTFFISLVIFGASLLLLVPDGQ